jgi:taurine dioxygenase
MTLPVYKPFARLLLESKRGCNRPVGQAITRQGKPKRMAHRKAISIEPLNPVVGAELHGLDLRETLPDEDIQAIKAALDRYQVIFFRDQDITPEQHLAFGRRFGELHVHPSVRGKPRDQWSELMPVHADATTARIAGDKWHTDVSCDEKPPLASILHLTTIPETGGDTLFSSMSAAYDALSEPMKRLLTGLTATHDGAPNYNDRARKSRDQNPDRVNPVAVHPVIAAHPSTGKKTIYVNSTFTVRINELGEDESEAVLAFLFAHVARPEFQCRFRWRRNSIAFWDNRAVQHYAVWDYFPAVRTGRRVTIRGERPHP